MLLITGKRFEVIGGLNKAEESVGKGINVNIVLLNSDKKQRKA